MLVAVHNLGITTALEGRMASRSKRSSEDLKPLPPTPQWRGRHSLELVCQFNQRCLQMVGEAVASDNGFTAPALAENRTLWATMDDAARMRAAQLPFVIMDARFADTEWWRNIAEGRAHVDSVRGEACLSEQLMEETLLFAAQTVKWDSSVARLILGMSPTVAVWLKELSPRDVANIWRQHRTALQLRWHDKAEFWRDLLTAAVDADEEALAEYRIEAQLMFCADLVQLQN